MVAAAPPDTNPEAEQVNSPAEQALADPNTANSNQNFRENVEQRSEASPSRSIEPGHSFGTGPDIIAASNHDEETIEQASEVIEQAYPGGPGNDLWPFSVANISMITDKGPSIKYVSTFLAIFNLPCVSAF